MTRVLTWIGAAIIAVLGLSCVAAGATVHAYLSDPAALSQPLPALAGTQSARGIVVDIAGTSATMHGLTLPGRPQLLVSSRHELRAGTAPAPDADAALTGVAYDVASLNGGTWSTRSVPGSTEAPAIDAAWMRTGRTISVPMVDGQTLVIANADGSAPVDVSLALTLPDDFARNLVAGLLALGALLLALAIAVGAIAIGGTRHSISHPSDAAGS